MSTATHPESPQSKADRKASARAAKDPASYEATEFGRRRVTKLPGWIRKLGTALSTAGAFLLRLVRPNRPSPTQ